MKNYTVNKFCCNCEHCSRAAGNWCCDLDNDMPVERYPEDRENIKALKKWLCSHRVSQFGTCDDHKLAFVEFCS